eukprot:m.146284 g.146284  ORF g.146284 m.146284 type:complete len:298 (+) comp14966_c0_seq18:185-1078(+)
MERKIAKRKTKKVASEEEGTNDFKRHQVISNWLESIFGRDSVPKFKINAESQELLFYAALNFKANEKFAKLLIEDLEGRTQEYNAEALRLNRLLKNFGIDPTKLGKAARSAVKNITRIADTLHVKDLSTTTITRALQHMDSEIYETEKKVLALSESIRRKKLHLEQLQRKVSGFDSVLERLEQELLVDEKKHADRIAKTKFFNQKAADYEAQIALLESKLRDNGYSYDISHSGLLQRAKEQQKLSDRGDELKTSLDKYLSLPPDLSLASVKLWEAKEALAKVDCEIANLAGAGLISK